MKKLEDMTPIELYVEAFCGLVCPFPRLTAFRQNPEILFGKEYAAWYYEQICADLEREKEYFERKNQATLMYYRYIKAKEKSP